jgi:siroheme synthase-like protein
VLVGGGPVATAKLRQLLAAGARVRVIAPEISDEIQALVAQPFQGRDRRAAASAPEALRRASPKLDGSSTERRRESPAPQPEVTIAQRPFVPADLDEAWLVVAAATPEVNRHVAEVAETRRLFVNAVDDPANASAFLSGVIRRDGVTLAISTSGAAPALTALLREGLDALLPRDLGAWMWRARAARVAWRREGVPMDARKPRLLEALNALYGRPEGLHDDCHVAGARPEGPPCDRGETGGLKRVRGVTGVVRDFSPAVNVPWLNGPEDSWL